ncbi:phage tail protein [Bradyrhizobium acaciae]|uniref:phage tail protein n=1 Tax=Bradyrhizobium acaciae TaxID=2683706 RepID=UPI001E30DC95|nr:tail fiber protein [Bradyrhizobium acaciae]MCC8980973.1 phage tail protein [Bradyrhizobium acaciae]
MAQPYVGEIRMFGGNFAPVGWNFCDGSLLPISDYETLFNLIGTTYGGDGQSNFAVPDLRGRLPLHMGTASSGTSYVIGETGGVENVTLTTQTIPQHSHAFIASTQTGTGANPQGNILDQTSGTIALYIDGQPPDGPMAAGMLTNTGGSQPHDNLQPLLCVTFIISLFGIFPTQT